MVFKMSALKEQAFEIIRSLPQEKIPTVITVLRGNATAEKHASNRNKKKPKQANK